LLRLTKAYLVCENTIEDTLLRASGCLTVSNVSGRTFLVPEPDRTTDTLMTIIDAWTEPGTTVISDCWDAYQDLDALGYKHQTAKHTISFINEEGDHTNTTKSKWAHVKAYLKSYKRPDYIYHFAHYMFTARCKAERVHQFKKFLHLVVSTGWSCAPPL